MGLAWRVILAMVGVVLLAAGCAEVGTMGVDRAGLLAVMRDEGGAGAGDARRIEADRRLVGLVGAGGAGGVGGVRDEGRLEALEAMVGGRGQSETMQIYALDRIRAADRERAVRVLRERLPRMEDWAVLEHACAMAVELGDKTLAGAAGGAARAGEARLGLIDALVESLARPAKRYARVERPEAKAIEKLTGMGLVEALTGVMMGGREFPIADVRSQRMEARVGAMDLLMELRGGGGEGGGAYVKVMLRRGGAAHAGDGFLADMAWWVGLFDTVPAGMQEVEWVEELRRGGAENAGLVKAAAAGHARLKGEKDYVFAPRFVGVLAHYAGAAASSPPSLIGWKADPTAPPSPDRQDADPTRAALAAEIRAELAGLKHVGRVPSYAGAPDDVDESFGANEANEGKLSRCDLLAIRALLAALREESFRREVMRLGLEDRADVTSEHGGLIVWKGTGERGQGTASGGGGGGLVLRIYPPAYGGNDKAYMSSDKLLRETVLGLAEFHFHFQEERNERNAGPGMGDLRYVRETGCNGVVFTSVAGADGRDGFDVDYYTPGGAVVDLGVWE